MSSLSRMTTAAELYEAARWRLSSPRRGMAARIATWPIWIGGRRLTLTARTNGPPPKPPTRRLQRVTDWQHPFTRPKEGQV